MFYAIVILMLHKNNFGLEPAAHLRRWPELEIIIYFNK